MKRLQHVDPALKQLLAKIPQEIIDTFTEEERKTIQKAFGRHTLTRHPLDLKVSIPIPGLNFYLVLLADPEGRFKQRLQSQKSLYFLWNPSNIMFIIGFFIILLTSGFTTFSFVLSLFPSTSTSFYPTSIPWLDSKSKCEHTRRIWRNEKCWDYEHNPMF
ncbi:hypothetical protein [Brasilonema sp. UFV-L1]|uniref:hypothetical protein n=1 Tax=Brasilonema sp. UFV-L1 TaxID=2234130 RepID=UPI00145FBE9E|nr:hypothetical protein [Brasilonema sp. UFV-L1]NMG06984.1 hypothetical protein [Brasilonema sp. UFV-L1]